MMTGHEKVLGRISLFTLVLNIILNLLLIPYYGAIGAAVTTTTTIILENIIKVILVKNRIGLSTIPFIMSSNLNNKI